MRFSLLGLVVMGGMVTGCAVSERAGVVGGTASPGGRLVVATMPAGREGESAANSFSRDIFGYEGRAPGERSGLTAGWMERPVKFEVQHPFDLKLGDRWSYDAGTDTADVWALGTDRAHLPPPNRTTARTELRLIDPEYLPGTGLHMMTCEMFIVPGTFATITQVFARGPMGMIVVDPEGTITDLRTHAVIATGMNGKWFKWAVVHDTGAVGKGAIKVYVDGKLADGEVSANRSASYYFKVGVYSRHGSDRSEVKVRDLRVWAKKEN